MDETTASCTCTENGPCFYDTACPSITKFSAYYVDYYNCSTGTFCYQYGPYCGCA